ncbi:MAG: M20/M25/M40 family metallo-hydrolase [Pirellulales bacterium]
MSNTRRHCVAVVAAGLVICAVRPALAVNNSLFAAALNSISEDDLYKHVEVLADDVYEGRAAGSRGGHAAGQYIIDLLKQHDLTPAGEQGDYAQPFSDDCRNLLAKLPGDDPAMENEWIVVGAHYDHVGYGKQSNSYGPYGQIHNGADDNASGASVMLELIEAFAKSGLKTRRSILFAFWDAEERGLVGSKHWIAQPTVPIDNVKLDITIDMVGRLRDERLQVLGTRSGYGMRRLFSNADDDSMLLDFSWELSANSDHWPFLEHGVPIALMHTGLHSDYHRPSDDVEKINRAGMRKVSRYLFTALVQVANAEQLPKFRSAVRRENERMRRELEQPKPLASLAAWPADLERPRFGATWRADEAEPGSVFLTRVVTGSPADNAGLKVGDRINAFDGQPFADSDALFDAMRAQLDAGTQQLSLLIERNGHVRNVVVPLAPPTPPAPPQRQVTKAADRDATGAPLGN